MKIVTKYILYWLSSLDIIIVLLSHYKNFKLNYNYCLKDEFITTVPSKYKIVLRILHLFIGHKLTPFLHQTHDF